MFICPNVLLSSLPIVLLYNYHHVPHVSECTELARAKELALGWLGSARRQGQNLSLARLGLEIILNFELSSVQTWKNLNLRAELGSSLGGSEHFEIDPIRPIWIKLDLTVKLLPTFVRADHFCPTLTHFNKNL